MAVGGGMGRLLGLGFVFGARDNGAVRTTTDLAEGMDRVATSAQEAGRQSSALSNLGETIARLGSAGARGMTDLGERLSGLADMVGINPSDTGIESFGVEFSNTWRRATVGLGPFREQVEGMRGEISSLAYSMDVDAGEMITAVTGLARSGHSLEDFGLTLRGVAGSIQSGGLNGEQFASVLTSLSEGYDLGTEGAGRLIDRLSALGEASGFGADAMRALPDMIAAANPVLAQFSGISIDQATESITRLALVTQRRLGGTFADAMTSATSAFTQLGSSRRQLSDLVTGISSDFPELATSIAVASGDIDGALNMVMSDPMAFAQQLQGLYGTLDQFGQQRLLSQLGSAGFDDNFLFLIQGAEGSAEAMAAGMAPIQNFEGAFNRMATSGAGTSRTFAESMSRLADGFETRLHGMTSITTREVLGRQRDAFNRLGNTIQGFVDRGGPLGLLTQGFLNVRRYGLVHGLLPLLEDRLANTFPNLSRRIHEYAPAMEMFGEGLMSAAQSMGPLLVVAGQSGLLGLIPRLGTALMTFGTSAMTALGPVGIAAIAIGAAAGLIYYNWETLRDFFVDTDWADIAHTAAQGFLTGLNALWDWSEDLSTQIADIDWHGVGESIGDGFRMAWSFVSGLFTGEFNEDITQFFGDAFAMDPSEILPVIGTMLRDVLQNTLGSLDTIFHDIVSGIFGDDSMWVDLFDTMFAISPLGALQRALDADNITDGIIAIMGTVLGPGAALYSWAYDQVNQMWEGIFGESLMDSFTSIPSALLGAVDAVLGVMLWPFEQLFGGDRISELFHQGGVMAIFEDFGSLASAIFDAMGDVWNDLFVPMGEVAFEILSEVGAAFSELWTDTLAPVLGELRAWWDDEFGGEVMPDAQDNIQSTGDSFRRMWQRTIRPALIDFARFSVRVFTEIQRVSMLVWTSIGRQAVRSIFGVIGAITQMRVRFETVRDVLMAGWEIVGLRIRRFFTEPILEAGDSFMTIFENINMTIAGMRRGFLGIVESLVSALQSAFNAIPDVIRRTLGMSGDVMAGAASSIHSAVEAEDRSLSEMRSRIALDQQNRRQQRDEYAAQNAAAIAAQEARRREAVLRAASEQARLTAMEDRTIGGMDRFGESVDHGLARISERVENMGDATPVAIGSSEASSASGNASSSDPSEPVLVRSVEEERSTPAERSRMARERHAAAEGATETARTETARATAREMVIGSFGTEAARQLASAFSGGGGGGRVRRAPRSSPGGDPATQ